MDIFARDYGVLPSKSVGKELNELFFALKDIEGDKRVIFDEGEYYIDSEDVPRKKVYITNTIGVKEWRQGEEYQMKSIAMDIESVSDVSLIGNGASFILRGVMDNMHIVDSSNVHIEGITIDSDNPDLHMMTITRATPTYFEFELDERTEYTREGNKYYFVGKDYRTSFTDSRAFAWWIGYVDKDRDNIRRVAHPLRGAFGLKEIAPHRFRAYKLFNGMSVGDIYHLYEVRRKNVGIYIDRSKDVTLKGVTSHFNYSLGVVAVDTENITIDDMNMTPSPRRNILMSAIADFMHLCMCRGDIIITNGKFVGAGDDCLNVHGIHFGITKVDGDKIVVKFMHPQAYGFNPLRIGDTIEFVDRASLMARGSAKILESTLIDEYEIELTLDDTSKADTSLVIEDITACPNLRFEGNYLNRIITRGILITTRGKVEVKDNNFNSCTMHSILFSDDANSWYESGRVTNALIEGNTFGYCPMYNIYIKPENKVHEDYVHGDFVIRNNTFNSAPNGGIYAKSSRSLLLENNTAPHDMRINITNVGKLDKK